MASKEMKEKLRKSYGMGLMVFAAFGIGFFFVQAFFTFGKVDFAFCIIAILAAILGVVVGYKIIKKGVVKDETT